MKKHLSPELSAEIRAATRHLSLYNNGPAVDYTNAEVAYVASITLLHIPEGERASPDSEVLVVQRGRGDWHERVWGNVSGYVDTMDDPDRKIPTEAFDPVAFTVGAELAEECMMPTDAIDAIDFRLGERFTETRFSGKGIMHVLPILGICIGEQKPPVKPDKNELLDHSWVPLKRVANLPNLSPGYISHTLPGALGALGLRSLTF